MAAKKSSKTALPKKAGFKNPTGSQYTKIAKNLNSQMGKPGSFAARKMSRGK